MTRLRSIARVLDVCNSVYDQPDSFYTVPNCLAVIFNVADDGLSSLFNDPVISPCLGGFSAEVKDDA